MGSCVKGSWKDFRVGCGIRAEGDKMPVASVAGTGQEHLEASMCIVMLIRTTAICHEFLLVPTTPCLCFLNCTQFVMFKKM